MRITFNYIISNSSDKTLGPLDLEDMFGPFEREVQSASIGPDGYMQTKGCDVIAWEATLRKLESVAAASDIPGHLVHLFREVDHEAVGAPQLPPAIAGMPSPDPAILVLPAPIAPKESN